MFVSTREIDKIVKQGGNAHINYWAYDIVAERIEKIGFRRRKEIKCQGPFSLDGSIYCNDDGDEVVITTHRFMPFTTVTSIPKGSGNKQDQQV
jgi:hypothetical protein